MKLVSRPAVDGTLEFRFDFRWLLSFTALVFIHAEFHEIAHTAVGRLLCGAWGPRNFNYWEIACSDRPALLLSSVAGLLFSYGLMWVGYYLLRPGTSSERKSLGFCLMFAAIPFGRLATVGLGGGDEMFLLETLFTNTDPTLLWVVAVGGVFGLITPPLYRAFTALSQQRRWLVFVGFLFIPILVFMTVILGVGNTLLREGVLARPGILGSPLIVNVWTGLWLVLLVALWRHLSTTLIPMAGEQSVQN